MSIDTEKALKIGNDSFSPHSILSASLDTNWIGQRRKIKVLLIDGMEKSYSFKDSDSAIEALKKIHKVAPHHFTLIGKHVFNHFRIMSVAVHKNFFNKLDRISVSFAPGSCLGPFYYGVYSYNQSSDKIGPQKASEKLRKAIPFCFA